VLRSEEDGDGSGLSQLDSLVARARAAGLDRDRDRDRRGAGPQDDGGFQVRAELPTRAPS